MEKQTTIHVSLSSYEHLPDGKFINLIILNVYYLGGLIKTIWEDV